MKEFLADKMSDVIDDAWENIQENQDLEEKKCLKFRKMRKNRP